MHHIEPEDTVRDFCKFYRLNMFFEPEAVHILDMASYVCTDWQVATNTDRTFRTECSFNSFCTVHNLDECTSLG